MTQASTAVNILCLKWGTLYGAHYVNRLYTNVKKHLARPFRFVCVTEDCDGLLPGIETAPIPPDPGMTIKWPNVFMKLLVTADGFADLKGPTLFCDLDMLITGNLECFFDYLPGKNCIIHNWVEKRKTIFRAAPAIGNSSLFRFEAGSSHYIYETFLSEMERAIDQKYFRTEQAFMTYAMRERYWWPDEWVSSFKRHSMWSFPLNYLLTPRLPSKTRVLVFHGDPTPAAALRGYSGKRLHHFCRPATWIERYWQEQ